MAMRGDRTTELLIVGAGPVGLFAGLRAAEAGIDATIVDHTYRGFGRGYAALLHPSTLRLLDGVGVGGVLRRAGREIKKLGVRVDGAPRVELELPSPALAVAQSALEDALLGALRRTNVQVLTPCEASMIQQHADGVRVRVERRELVTLGSPADYSSWEPVESHTVDAAYVIGADGYDSRIRSAIGADVVKLGETETFAMFEAPSHPDASDAFELGFSEGLASAVIPLAGTRARFGFQLDSGLDAEPNADRLHELLASRAQWFRDGLTQVDWSTVIQFERRLVRRFGSGRVWLAGDAAHVTSPLGAQSMNLGLAEAADLVAHLDACLNRGRSPETLLAYGSEHQREWHKLLGYHVRFDVLPHAPPWLAALAREVPPVLPVSGADLREVLKQLGLKVS
jgi:2-polyprenyl-6-methoxyphenol hydroxylase-like FAD-dependent oxidoreductase